MKKIFVSGNYIIADNDGTISEYAQNRTSYTETATEIILNEERGGRLIILKADSGTWFDSPGTTAYTTATLIQFFRNSSGASTPAYESYQFDVDVSLGFQTIVINTSGILENVNRVSFAAISVGLNGTGSDLDFSEVPINDGAGTTPRIQVGGTISVTPGVPNSANAGGAVTLPYLLLDFEPNDAALGTITVFVTFRG